ncbi:hypothetical protein C8T65DRAFT_663108 [Cerioporus squamosus]|nr:hypothetical protein C8T65DRAFT_663108 [Cerioporus squamosus]
MGDTAPTGVRRGPSSTFPTMPGPSALCEDVLYHIFENVGEQDNRLRDWATAALVCRSWTRPVQAAMYNSFVFYASQIHDVQWEGFVHSLQAYPHLRSLLRHLTIWQSGNPAGEQFMWMGLLPEDTLQILQYSWRQHKPLLSIFDIPAVRTITQLDITGEITPAIAKICLAFPFLQTLSVTFYKSTEVSNDWELEVTLSPSLKHLVLIMHDHNVFAHRLLAACAPQLSTLALFPPSNSMHDHGAALADTLLTRTGQLTELSLCGPRGWSPTRPFMNHLVLQNPTLERLCCLQGTYSEQLFQCLPARLRVLELATGAAPYPYERALLEYIARVGQWGLSLRRLCLRMSRKDEEPWAYIADSCKKSGVEFCVDVYQETLCKARGREWSA